MKLRDMATTWIRANCPIIEVQRDFQRHFDHAMQQRATCSFMVGRKLTSGGKPYLVYCFGGEFFAFALTNRQVAKLGMKDNVMACAMGAPRDTRESAAEPVVTLEEVTVSNADSLSRSLPISGTLQYRAKQVVLEPVAIHVECEPPGCGSTRLFHHLPCLAPQEGRLDLTLHALGDLRNAQGEPFTGVLPLFFQVWTAPAMPASSAYPPAFDPSPTRGAPAQHEKPISDIRALLVEVY